MSGYNGERFDREVIMPRLAALLGGKLKEGYIFTNVCPSSRSGLYLEGFYYELETTGRKRFTIEVGQWRFDETKM